MILLIQDTALLLALTTRSNLIMKVIFISVDPNYQKWFCELERAV